MPKKKDKYALKNNIYKIIGRRRIYLWYTYFGFRAYKHKHFTHTKHLLLHLPDLNLFPFLENPSNIIIHGFLWFRWNPFGYGKPTPRRLCRRRPTVSRQVSSDPDSWNSSACSSIIERLSVSLLFCVIRLWQVRKSTEKPS